MENKSSFLKDAIESITTLANKAKDPKTLEYNSHLYLIDERGNANRIWEMKDTPEKKRVCSLDALVALIKHEAVDRYATNAHPLFVNCESFGSVTCYLSPDSGNYENRVTLYEAAATDVPGFRDSKWSLEEAMVALRSKFQHTDDVDYILGLIGRMDVNQQISSEDNGVTQTVQVRSGVSFVENQQVRPIVSLAPYRTFQEVLQPESDFVFRVDQDRNVSLTEADGGMWKLAARNAVKTYVKAVGGTILPGYQLRYIYFIDPEYRKRLKVPEIPFSRIDELNAGMYKGESITQAERHAASHYEP